MAPRAKKPPVDDEARERAIRARDANVLIDAGAGTGKTTLIVHRLVEMVAPESDEHPAIPLERVAAVTFTRRAAGELRLRIRERLLGQLARGKDLSAVRQERLRRALGALDTAFVGTIHSFADRLLRLRPMEAQISPAYDIAEDAEDLVGEAYGLLLHGAQQGTLAADFRGEALAERAEEAQQTVLDALRVGLRATTEVFDQYANVGLDTFVAGLLELRDVPFEEPALEPFDVATFRKAADELIGRVARIEGEMRGTVWFRRVAKELEERRADTDPRALFEVLATMRYGTHYKTGFTKTKDFDKGAARKLWEDFAEPKNTSRGSLLFDDLAVPIERWLALRLVRLKPIAAELYERVKVRRGAVDSIDLLLKLRDLLAEDVAVRREYQRLFDHVFVDEFQDTDPLQAEVLLYLTEAAPARAKRWQDVRVGAGRLTIVGDPKQSIYRFRRADVAMYDQIRAKIASGEGVVEVRLEANFRSTPALIGWNNHRFAEILGTSPEGRVFDAKAGKVFHQPLRAGRTDAAEGPSVHVLPYEAKPGEKGTASAEANRRVEAEATAHYLRWLVERSDVRVEDESTGERRRPTYSDVAVLALVTTKLPLLFEELDRARVPYAPAGGSLFLRDPLHAQFILGLRAIADRDDGVAQAALLRPPFFALELHDVIAERVIGEAVRAGATDAPPVPRLAAEATALVRDLRAKRFARSPGATARALLEQTAFARVVALGPNGAQRLRHLRELCTVLDHLATTEGLDFDGVTARMRPWVETPVQLDPPRPVGSEAVQILTAHQAKGLEFPVVVMWDGCALWKAYERPTAWRVDRNGRGWALKLQGLDWEEPRGAGLLDEAQQFADEEKRRLVYVATTRARDLLVVPKALGKEGPGYACATLLAHTDAKWTHEVAVYKEGKGAPWAKPYAEEADPAIELADERATRERRWSEAAGEALRPRARPASVTSLAHRAEPDAVTIEASGAEGGEGEVAEALPPRKPRPSRFGPVFGETVHRAIGVAASRGIDARAAVAIAANATGLTEKVSEAEADVTRALTALKACGVLDGGTWSVEYPVAKAVPEQGLLVSGYIDLLHVDADARVATILDFKTDAALAGEASETYPEYARQVASYAKMVTAASLAATVRSGLLFTEDGSVRWVSASDFASGDGRS